MKLTWLAFGLALAATVFWLFEPAYRVNNGTRSLTMLQVNGPRVLWLLALPTVVAALPLIWRRRWVRIVSAVVLIAFAFVSGASVGLFYWPAAIAMALAGAFEW